MLEGILSVAFLTTFFASAVRMAVPLIFAGIGENFSEKTGILNIGLEGIMLSGAFFGFITAFFTGSLWMGFLGGAFGGLVVSMVHGWFAIYLKQDQSVVGIALNLFVLGLTSFLFKIFSDSVGSFSQITTFSTIKIPVLSQIPIIGEALFHQDIIAYLSYVLVILSFVFLVKTKSGLAMIAVGEHPKAAESVGLDVFKIQYVAVAINGILGGIGGAYLTLVQLGMFTENITAGRGYIALAVVIFGKRNPLLIFVCAIIFGAADALQFRLQAVGIALPSQLMIMLPYVITILVLIITYKKSGDPAHLGKAFIRGTR